jgi:hypothetical protein
MGLTVPLRVNHLVADERRRAAGFSFDARPAKSSHYGLFTAAGSPMSTNLSSAPETTIISTIARERKDFEAPELLVIRLHVVPRHITP